MRRGHFSPCSTPAHNYQIYDPFSTTPEGVRFRRQPLPGNIVPANRISPDAARYLKYFPLPTPPAPSTSPTTTTAPAPTNRTSTSPSSALITTGPTSGESSADVPSRCSMATSIDGWKAPMFAAASANGPIKATRSIRSASLELHLHHRCSLRLHVVQREASLRQSRLRPIRIRLPVERHHTASTRVAAVPTHHRHRYAAPRQRRRFRPALLHPLAPQRAELDPWNTAIKFGFDGRLTYDNSITFGNVTPALTFGDTYTRGPLDNAPGSPGAGQNFASLLYGIPTAGGMDMNDSRAETSPFHSLFVQDDWRVTKTLTLNLGFRWEYEGPVVERYNRNSRDFDFTTANPIEAPAHANYARCPIAEISLANFHTTGGLTFRGRNGVPRASSGRPSTRPSCHASVSPGTPTSKAVMRAGCGIFYDCSAPTSPTWLNLASTAAPTSSRRTTMASPTSRR